MIRLLLRLLPLPAVTALCGVCAPLPASNVRAAPEPPAATTAPLPPPTLKVQPLDPANALGRTMAKLKSAKALSIGYFGGSITAGAGASSSGKTSYRALTTAWFKQQFPAANITEIDASIGGTGSDLGAFRCQDDLLSKHPDLVFVEFAVNDGGGAEPRVVRAMEGIVRQIYAANPSAEIVFVYTATKSTSPAYEKGDLPAAVGFDHKVAVHYNLPEINVGYDLWRKVMEAGGKWEALTTDTVHPNDAGYGIYFQAIRRYLEAHLRDEPAADRAALPAPLDPRCFDRGRLVDAWTIDAPGWAKEAKSLGGHYPHRIAAETPGAELSFKFTGTAVGLFWLIAPDSGDIEWSVDGSKPARRSSWDKYALRYSRANYVLLDDSLPAGEHVLKIKVLEEKNQQSTGTAVRIGALLVQ